MDWLRYFFSPRPKRISLFQRFGRVLWYVIAFIGSYLAALAEFMPYCISQLVVLAFFWTMIKKLWRALFRPNVVRHLDNTNEIGLESRPLEDAAPVVAPVEEHVDSGEGDRAEDEDAAKPRKSRKKPGRRRRAPRADPQ